MLDGYPLRHDVGFNSEAAVRERQSTGEVPSGVEYRRRAIIGTDTIEYQRGASWDHWDVILDIGEDLLLHPVTFDPKVSQYSNDESAAHTDESNGRTEDRLSPHTRT